MSVGAELLEATGTAWRNGTALPAVKHYHRKRDRKRLRDNRAEAIAKSADRLEAAAAAVRPTDKPLALAMQKEAEHLHTQARRLEQQATRQRHAKAQKTQKTKKVQPRNRNSNWWET